MELKENNFDNRELIKTWANYVNHTLTIDNTHEQLIFCPIFSSSRKKFFYQLFLLVNAHDKNNQVCYEYIFSYERDFETDNGEINTETIKNEIKTDLEHFRSNLPLNDVFAFELQTSLDVLENSRLQLELQA